MAILVPNSEQNCDSIKTPLIRVLPLAVVRPAHGPQCWPITRRAPLKRTVGCQRGRPNYFQCHIPQFLTPTDIGGSCARGSAIPCKLERTLLAIAGVRRLFPSRSNVT